MRSLLDAPRFLLERWIQKGLWNQMLLMIALVGLVAVLGGLAAWTVTDAFAHPLDAVWWSFLRLTDPGYLGDDEGVALRAVSTVVTVLGYVLFMGSLIAIMTQWLAATLRQLESGRSPIRMKDHIVVLGWTNRTPEIVARLLGAKGRLERFLAEHSASRLRIVVLSDRVDAERRHELREYLGDLWDEDQVFLRSGSSLEPESLERLDPGRCSAIVVPGADFELGGFEATDARVVKTLLNLEALLSDGSGPRPDTVAEILEPQKVSIARSTMGSHLELVASDAVVSRIISQSLRHRTLGRVLLSILSHREPGSLYLRGFPELAGARPDDLPHRFPEAVVIGVVREQDGRARAFLNPPPSLALEASDLLVLLAASYDACEPTARPGEAPRPVVAAPAESALTEAPQRILLMGWSNKVGAILDELSECATEHFDVVNVSRLTAAEREQVLSHSGFDRARVRVDHVQADFTVLRDLEAVGPEGFDNVLFLASSLMDSSGDADARSILGYVLLKSLLEGREDPPEILVELLDPRNARLLRWERDLVLVSPQILSHILAHVALRPELNAVLEGLFRSGGAEIDLRRAGAYGLGSRTVAFAEVQRSAHARGEVALGVLLARGPRERRLQLAPPSAREWALEAHDGIVVLAGSETHAEGAAPDAVEGAPRSGAPAPDPAP